MLQSEAVCHEIGHVIHESNDPAAYGQIKDYKGLPSSVINNAINSLKQQTSSKLSQEMATIDKSEYSGLKTLLKNTIENIIKQTKGDGYDEGCKELIANIAGVYLYGNLHAIRFLENTFGFTSNEEKGNLINIVRGYMSNLGISFNRRRI